jgi:Tol biopolymer transport system component
MRRAERNWEVWIMPFSGDRKPFAFLTGPFSYFLPAFSPDVHWLAYQSDESGQNEVYVTTFPKAAGKWRISVTGGTAPVWRSDAKELYYVAPDRTLMAVAVNALGQDLKVGAVHSLFNLGTSQVVGENFDVARDGRFLVARDVPDFHPAPMVIVVNWPAELKK